MMGLSLMPSETAIQPLVLGEDDKVLAVAEQLQQQGFLVGAIRPPTVPEGSARLRITLNAGHTTKSIDELLAALQSALAENFE